MAIERKLAKIIDPDTYLVSVAMSGSPDEAYFLSNGYTWQDVEKCCDGHYYVSGHVPQEKEIEHQSRVEVQENEAAMEKTNQEYKIILDQAGHEKLRGTISPELMQKLDDLREILSLRARLTYDLILSKNNGDEESMETYNTIMDRLNELEA